MNTMQDIQRVWRELAKQIDQVNRDNGWDLPTYDNLPVKVAMAFTEVVEAQTEATTGDLPAFAEELADIAIRVLHILEAVWSEKWALRVFFVPGSRPVVVQDIERNLWPVLKQLSLALEYWRYDGETDVRICLEQAIREIQKLAWIYDVDLVSEIARKSLKNSKRGHLHGKAKSAG